MADEFGRPGAHKRVGPYAGMARKHPPKLNSKQRNQVKRLISNRQELKYIAGNGQDIVVDSTGALTGAPFDVPQGDTDITRDGDRLQWAGKIDFRFSLQHPLGTSPPESIVRLILFQWHPNSTPVISSILLTGPTGASDVWSTHSHDNRQMFRILFDRTFHLVGNAAAATTPNTTLTQIFRRFRVSLKKARKYAQYTGGTLTGTNRIFLIYISDAATLLRPTFTYSTKTFFRDS